MKCSWLMIVIAQAAYNPMNWPIFSMMSLKKCIIQADTQFNKQIKLLDKLTLTLMEGPAKLNFSMLWKFSWANQCPVKDITEVVISQIPKLWDTLQIKDTRTTIKTRDTIKTKVTIATTKAKTINTWVIKIRTCTLQDSQFQETKWTQASTVNHMEWLWIKIMETYKSLLEFQQ